MGKGTSREEEGEIKLRSYVSVVDTNDEWEGLIGRVEEFMSSEGILRTEKQEGDRAVVFFPLAQEEQRRLRMAGVNTYPSFVRLHLQQHEGKQVFNFDNLEEVDPEDL